MEWLAMLILVAAAVTAIVVIAGRAVRHRPVGGREAAANDPHAATLAEVNHQAGPRIYDVSGGGMDGGDGG